MKKSSIGKITIIKVNDSDSSTAEIVTDSIKNVDKRGKANERSSE